MGIVGVERFFRATIWVLRDLCKPTLRSKIRVPSLIVFHLLTCLELYEGKHLLRVQSSKPVSSGGVSLGPRLLGDPIVTTSKIFFMIIAELNRC